MGVRAPLPIKSPVSVPTLAMKSLILEVKVCFVSYGERRKKEPAAAGRLHGCSRCLGTLWGRGDPLGKGTPQSLPLVTGLSGKATARVNYGMTAAGLGGSRDLQELSSKCAHIYLGQLLNQWCQNYNL